MNSQIIEEGVAEGLSRVLSPYQDNAWANLTLRDYFAAQALASGRIRMPFENPRPDGGPSPELQTALEAYRVADAMLKAREQKPEAA
jgi:hypothetical protein